jgi:hypothetical protein
VSEIAHSLSALGRARVLHVPGADADANAVDHNYLVLTKPKVIMNDIRLRGWPWQEVTLPVGRVPTTTPRPLGTSDAPYRMRPAQNRAPFPQRYLPGLWVLRKHQRSWLRGDLLAGVRVGAYLVPQVMAYAEVAGLPAITRL